MELEELELPDIPPHPKVPLKTLDNALRDGRTQLEGKKAYDLLMGYDLRPIDSWGSNVCAAIWKVSTDIYCNRSRAYRLLKDWASTLEHDFPWHRLGMFEYDDTRVEQETGYSPEWIAELGEVELCLVEDTAKLESWVTDNKQRIVTWVAAVKKALDAAYMSLDDVPLAAKGFMLTYHLSWLNLDKIVCQLDELCTAIGDLHSKKWAKHISDAIDDDHRDNIERRELVDGRKPHRCPGCLSLPRPELLQTSIRPLEL